MALFIIRRWSVMVAKPKIEAGFRASCPSIVVR